MIHNVYDNESSRKLLKWDEASFRTGNREGRIYACWRMGEGGVSFSLNHVSFYLRVGVGSDTCIVLLIARHMYRSINRMVTISLLLILQSLH